ncbi:ABC transporter ATP-binding protein [Clostridium sp.]|jgi:sulfonate transport system ATP-binding protein|uniref:ABC transporter ATP-binding protein n=1 Tax=Clostridium sp. TaxID=1506 RepID=UPI003DAA1598
MAKGAFEMIKSSVANNASIKIKDVNRIYIDATGNLVEALRNINLDIRAGEFISLVGPSGCGKTTLMRLIAGLDKPQSGELFIDNDKINDTSFERGYVFQQANLFPWETIENNIAAGLKARKIYKESKDKIHEYIKLTGLEGFENSYPHQVSGGMAQRASLARALINDPKVLLLDEPLGALDAFTRMDLQDKLIELWQRRGTTMILVTHDVDEAIYLSDRAVIMTPRPGKIESIIDINLERPRDRTDLEFTILKKKILDKLHFARKH